MHTHLLRRATAGLDVHVEALAVCCDITLCRSEYGDLSARTVARSTVAGPLR